MDIKDIITIIEKVSECGLTGFELEEDGTRLSIRKKPAGVQAERYAGAPVYAAPGAETAYAQTILTGAAHAGAAGAGVPQMTDPQFGAVQAAGDLGAGTGVSAVGVIGSELIVKSPLVGTFYASSSPEAESFVKVGDAVKKGQVLGIIEAMKLMNEIESEYDGVVEAVLVKNEEFVEFGQPLFRIK